ncbi:MAG: hypothetical protein M3R23_01145 [Actinomycetota bacterium]|nr:hypothetical protein [Actinomycetota bacterium]
MPRADLEAEVIAEEDGGPVAEDSVRPLPLRYEPSVPALREVRTAAIAAAGGALAGVATVAAVRAVSSSSTRKRPQRRLVRRPDRPNVVASRSFLIDVHLLGR